MHIPGYNIIRKDRVERTHGGVCVYVQNQIKVEILSNFISPSFEVLWLKLRPRKLPRGISSIVLAAIYHPPGSDNLAMIDYLIDCLTRAEAMHSNCGIILMGDLNRLRTSSISRLFKLKQLVSFPTRGERTLDVILTNISQFFVNPEKMAPFGLSDHFTISLFPKIRNINTNRPRVVKSRDIRPSNKMALGRVLSTIDWSCLDLINSCEGKVDFFNQIVSDSLNLIMPIKTRTIHNNDAPWMSDKLKRSIKNRQRALQSGNSIEFKYYRNVVNMERKKCKSSYYDCKIKNLKHVKPKNWWSAVKKISGMDTITKSDLLSNLQIDDLDNLSDIEVANKINDKFLEPLQEFQPLQITVPNNDSISNVLTVSELDVWNCLNSLNPWKSGGPDNIPSWVFKEYAMILSLPVMKIINSSYTENKLPPIWKKANIIPVPKVTPAHDINQHLRPISLTPLHTFQSRRGIRGY